MSYLLDTVIVSQPDKPLPHSGVMRWLAIHEEDAKYLSVASVLELRMGVSMMSTGKRRDARAHFLEQDIPALFEERILPITRLIADDCGQLLGEARNLGYKIDPLDALIAATARVHGLAVVTLNFKHFVKLQVKLVDLDTVGS